MKERGEKIAVWTAYDFTMARLLDLAGMDVILDLHWSDRGDLGNQGPGQQRMADQNSITFWTQVAGK